MVNELLVNLVNGVLGTGKRTARGNQSFHCPFCNHHKPKLEVNFTEDKDGKNRWACWTCNKKGQTIYSLFKQMDVSPEIVSQLKPLVKSGSFVEKSITYNILELPKEFKKFDNSIISKHALNYLKKRNVTQSDILKYGMGYCEYGLYSKIDTSLLHPHLHNGDILLKIYFKT
jgi:transcription elongation factor Elf1